MFIGEYRHTVDDKNRISLPAKFRKSLGKKIVVSQGLDNCLFLFPQKTWEANAPKMAELGWRADARGFARFMFSGAADLEIDSLGRILIPDHLRQFAGFKNQVIFTGVHDRIEIWEEKRWRAYKKKIESQAEVMAEHLDSAGIK